MILSQKHLSSKLHKVIVAQLMYSNVGIVEHGIPNQLAKLLKSEKIIAPRSSRELAQIGRPNRISVVLHELCHCPRMRIFYRSQRCNEGSSSHGKELQFLDLRPSPARRISYLHMVDVGDQTFKVSVTCMGLHCEVMHLRRSHYFTHRNTGTPYCFVRPCLH